MSLKNVIKNAFLGVVYSFSLDEFKKNLIKDELDEGQLIMMRQLMIEQGKKMSEFIKIIDIEISLIKKHKNE
jgi:hypothetical protein